MKTVIGLLLIGMVFFGAYKVWNYWDTMDQRRAARAAVSISPGSLAGLPYQLEPSLDAAQTDGAKSLKFWLEKYGHAIQDPRLAWIELDYVLLVSRDDPIEAKKVFAQVKKRVPPDSPVYRRIKDLEKTYE